MDGRRQALGGSSHIQFIQHRPRQENSARLLVALQRTPATSLCMLKQHGSGSGAEHYSLAAQVVAGGLAGTVPKEVRGVQTGAPRAVASP